MAKPRGYFFLWGGGGGKKNPGQCTTVLEATLKKKCCFRSSSRVTLLLQNGNFCFSFFSVKISSFSASYTYNSVPTGQGKWPKKNPGKT